MHDVALVALEKVPGGHNVADDAPVPLTNEPAGAGVHAVAPGALE